MKADNLRWRTSSHSNNGGNCVEVATNIAMAFGVIPVRDSKVVNGPVLTIAAEPFSAFVAGLRQGSGKT
ncbi:MULTISPECIES: DUF397 domain-containing protein [unclassified Streptomyces]|uniref:DUF397 domain-containing protein n=1 Tax=unclassified Streptomyces TaxID=2593676 RepID=UPI00381A1B92